MAADPAERFAGAEEFRRALVDARDQSGSKGRRTSLAALAGVGLVAVAATLYFAIKPRLTDNPVIVVAPFVDRGSDPEATRVADLAADWVSREVARLQAMSVIPMSTARPAWISSPAPERTPAGLARATGAGIVVAGTYARAGTDVRFDIEIVDALRNRIIVALDPVVAPLDSSSAAVTRLADRVAGALAARVGPRSVEPASDPPSDAAFESYQRGMDAFVRSEWEQSISHFTAAMAIDSTYAPPVLWGATAYNNMGRFGTADTLLERLRPMTGRLMPLERVNYEWLRGIIRGDFASQLRWAREGYEIDRATWAFPYGQTLMRTNQPRQALEVLSHYHRNTPFARNWVPYWERTADARHRIGEYAVELDIAREWPGAPQAPRLRQLKIQVRAHAALGNLKELQRLLQLSETLPPDGEGRARTTPANVALVAAEELRAHGRPGAVQSVVDRALALDATAPYLRGQLLYASERWAEALIVFESLARANARNVDFLGSLGATYARLGRRVDAARVDSQLASLSDPYLRGANTLWRARLAAVAGDSAAAVRLIGEAMAAGAPVGMQLHADADFATIERYAPIQRLLNPSG
jgi:TolB-like protein/Flp pilus assembly protein TadD